MFYVYESGKFTIRQAATKNENTQYTPTIATNFSDIMDDLLHTRLYNAGWNYLPSLSVADVEVRLLSDY